jgi:V-type H+-transporting ATPase S1 subunit
MIFKGVNPNGPNKINLKAQFNISNGYFKFLGFQYQPDGNNIRHFLKSTSDIYFPFNFSYHCSKESIFSYKNKETKEEISLKIFNLQVQMDTKKFNDAYDCVGFMSIPIWTGIFVTSILAIIMIWGLTMIMDIRTMDRFDDPKGKTITISAQD